jgi:hypothetical protein
VLGALDSPGAWRIFMSHHVFAVWDFVTLLKRLQQELPGARLPAPAEELALYLQAMEECGADTGPMDAFLAGLLDGQSPVDSLTQAGAPEAVRQLVTTTLDIGAHGSVSEVCAAFSWGREALVPSLFEGLLHTLERSGQPAPRLHHYLQRHARLDADARGPVAQELLRQLRSGRVDLRGAATHAGLRALRARDALWSAALRQIEATRPAIGTLQAIV